MTSPKPFTAEQLDELEQELELCTYVRLRAEYLPEDSGKLSRLIAQAREANRLQGVIEEVAAFLRNGPPAATVERKEVLRFICYEQQASVDPAARAKRELGEWLVAHQEASYSTVDTSTEEYRSIHRGYPDEPEKWLCYLGWEDSCGGSITPVGDDKWFVGRGPTEADAITAALRAAKESGR